MFVVAVASQKGGSGKSTIAIHLATLLSRQNKVTLLADLDPHSQTSAEWASVRKHETPVVIKADSRDLKDLLTQAQEEEFDAVILDLPPYVDEVVKQATKYADLTLVPCRPSFSDLRTLPRMINVIHPPFLVVLNACPPGFAGAESSKTKEARTLLGSYSIPVATFSITQRVAFSDALNGGEAVIEYDPSSKASIEIKQLLKSVIKEIQKHRSTVTKS